ncbi:47fd00dc-1b66-4a3c-a15a-1d59ef50c4cd [Sclerotinia trifoliorum]|uniref:47fd00dc-1b66-4a3c-a15a-1d59ef50c4cd n=1 Tax=Sclerotinia trifoliorum TaxID=28548 RepID=A0A8H2VTN6_9HELO|nr:47fd00dc-1b66-4a3c-a15a-1d59ef50c4cd [Sclerotinia trifoliorum]
MSETPSTPRITSPYLNSFTSRTVRMVGQVTQLRGEQASIDCDGPVTLILSRDSHLQVGSAIEIVGKVNQDLSVKVLKATDFGTNFNFAAMTALVDANHRYKEIWYSEDS